MTKAYEDEIEGVFMPLVSIDCTFMCCLTTGLHFDKCVVRQFCHFVIIIENVLTQT